MSLEYVRFSGREGLYGEKNLLKSELTLLGFIKRMRNYKKLRNEELALKIVLKKKVDELKGQLEILDKILPHTKMAGLIKRPKPKNEMAGLSAEDKATLTLEQEVEAIRRKLETLKDF